MKNLLKKVNWTRLVIEIGKVVVAFFAGGELMNL